MEPKKTNILKIFSRVVRALSFRSQFTTLAAFCKWSEEDNQSILKQVSPEYSLEGLMLKLKIQHFGHLM